MTSEYFGGPNAVWKTNSDQGTAWDTKVPSSLDASHALVEIAKQLPSHGEAFNVVNLTEGSRASGADVLSESAHLPPFRIDRVAEFTTLGPGGSGQLWQRLRGTGQYSVLMRSGPLAAGFIARRDSKTGTWHADQEQELANGFSYLQAIDQLSKRSTGFAVRIVLGSTKPAASWFVFRLDDGTELATPVFLVPNYPWNAAGDPVRNGGLYPASYVLRPVAPS